MMTKKPRTVKKIKMGDELRACPACGYEDGFHNMFAKTKDKTTLNWYLVCPQCSSTFDIGLKVSID